MKKASFLSVAFGLVLGGVASADMITLTQLQVADANAPTVNINYTSNDGHNTALSESGVYADPQVSLGTTAPLFYCVDLWHDNPIGTTYNLTSQSSISFSNTSSYTDADNRVAWLLSQDTSTTDARAAVQLAIWRTIDNEGENGFSFSNYGTDTSDYNTIVSDYNALILFNGYNSSVNYAATFYTADDMANQNLVEGPNGGVGETAIPEPSSLILGAIGSLCFAGLYLRRRPA
jgi:Thioester domain/PEP-CTERM motif